MLVKNEHYKFITICFLEY